MPSPGPPRPPLAAAVALPSSYGDKPGFGAMLGGSSGVRVGTTLASGGPAIQVTAGGSRSSLVDVFAGATLALLDEYFAFDLSFRGASFVGG